MDNAQLSQLIAETADTLQALEPPGTIRPSFHTPERFPATFADALAAADVFSGRLVHVGACANGSMVGSLLGRFQGDAVSLRSESQPECLSFALDVVDDHGDPIPGGDGRAGHFLLDEAVFMGADWSMGADDALTLRFSGGGEVVITLTECSPDTDSESGAVPRGPG